MICQNCKVNVATNHFHSVVNGVVRDNYLCNECSKNYKASAFADNDFFSVLSSFFNDVTPKQKEALRCPQCNSSFDEISKTGKVGCGNCYSVFENQLAPALLKLHGDIKHIGKKPNQNDDDTPINKESVSENCDIERLKSDLKIAIAKEEYEKAAVLRDKIRKAEGL